MSATAGERWLTIIGVGEDGLDGLSPAATRILAQARFVIGGARHLAMLKSTTAETMEWPSPFERGVEAIKARRGAPTCVLASGDPFLYGVGSTLAAHIPPQEMISLPAPSSLSLAAARLGWALQDCDVVSLHGRPFERILLHLRPCAKLLVLSWDEKTPERLANLLVARWLGGSRLIVMAALGGPRESIVETTPETFAPRATDPLNLVAIEIHGEPDAPYVPLTPGLPDDWYESDGQLTKRQIRAITLSALAPWPGARLWDIGAGSGSIAIEWMLTHPRNRAVAIEARPERAARIARNAAALGAPDLQVLDGDARALMGGLPAPDAIFVGGGGAAVIDAAWELLPLGRRLVANAVTIETQAALAERQRRLGGDLISVTVAHIEPVGSYRGWRTAMPVVQWSATKR
jgi:precorrin-6B C5,15-methyltransferase / cobalt-precorrin-6B C5,C15-methyltransferase